ncbi:hypothetical protein Tco_0823533 [Tanacetum coccineum]|uniref:Uncharacterized protein n=1 Tax=Tanacetum coccineum TaxID=301880 RepID=A0ABQ5AN60_9ASTR
MLCRYERCMPLDVQHPYLLYFFLLRVGALQLIGPRVKNICCMIAREGTRSRDSVWKPGLTSPSSSGICSAFLLSGTLLLCKGLHDEALHLLPSLQALSMDIEYAASVRRTVDDVKHRCISSAASVILSVSSLHPMVIHKRGSLSCLISHRPDTYSHINPAVPIGLKESQFNLAG